MIGAATRVFAVLGDPVAHSLSPAMHNAAFASLGVDAVYVALRCDAHMVGPLMDALAAAGGGGNVTVPHKRAAATHAGLGDAEVAGGVNTFWGEGGALRTADTDSVGIAAAWRQLGAPAGDWLIVGTGGSARAAVLAARACGAGVAVRSRAAERAAGLEEWAIARGGQVASARSARFVVNCTPLGLRASDPYPIDPAGLPEGAVALDLVYARGATRWTRAVRGTGRRAGDGREVLLAQGAEAFRLWFPGIDPPTEVMRAAIRSALEPAPK